MHPESTAAAVPGSDAAVTPKTPKQGLPIVTIEQGNFDERMLTRTGVLINKKNLKEQREQAFRDAHKMSASSEKSALYREIRACTDEEEELERHLQTHFIPQHGPLQFLSPRAFFVSALFRARGKSISREMQVECHLPTPPGVPSIRYSGPELRQSDARVFLALLNMLRDVRVGTQVRLEPEPVCIALFGRYDGNSRRQLRTHIQRLQKGLVISDEFSVQLCLGFDYPKRGGWTIGLDPHIAALFRISREVWFEMEPRLALTDGLATWLYTYIESQTRLIPMCIATLRDLCGSDADDRAFTNSLRLALRDVADTGIIATGWSLRKGQVRWLKTHRPA